MKRKLLIILIAVFFIFSLVGCLDTRAEDPYESPATYEQLRIQMLQRVEPSVVAVETDSGFGSGVIFQKDETEVTGEYLYYVLTNYHVIETSAEEDGEISIYYGDDMNTLFAQDYQGNAAYDVAVVRFVSNLNFPAIDIKQITDNIIVEIVAGQDVYAIGTPDDLLNFNYITSGVVSIVSKAYNGINGLTLMHDAELNPGNSGGPLFNLNGDVIGLNVAKDTWIPTENDTIAAEGLNYALNMNTLAPVIRSFTEASYNDVSRSPKFGFSVVELADYLTENPEDDVLFDSGATGLVIVGFDVSRNAVDVLEELDLIVEIDGTTIETIEDILALVDGAEFGDSFSVTVVRKEGTSFVEHTYDIELS